MSDTVTAGAGMLCSAEDRLVGPRKAMSIQSFLLFLDDLRERSVLATYDSPYPPRLHLRLRLPSSMRDDTKADTAELSSDSSSCSLLKRAQRYTVIIRDSLQAMGTRATSLSIPG